MESPAPGKPLLVPRWGYRSTSEDFVDCILAAEHELSGRRILTFDKGLTRLVNERDGFPAV